MLILDDDLIKVFYMCESNKSKAPRLSIPIHHNHGVGDGAELPKVRFQAGVGGAWTEAPDEDLDFYLVIVKLLHVNYK